MKLNHLKIVALYLGVAMLVMTASAMASTTVVYPLTTAIPGTLGTAGPVLFDMEQGAANAVWSFPGATNCSGYNAVIAQKMNVIRQYNTSGSPQNYFVYLTLDNGAIWQTAPADPTNWFFTNQGTTQPTVHLIGGVGTATLRYYVLINSSLFDLSLNTIYIPLGLYTVRDPLNRIGTGQTIGVTVTETDGATDIMFETSQATLIQGAPGNRISVATTVGHAVIDTLTNRTTFVEDVNVDTNDDYSASIGINISTVFNRAGCVYMLSNLSSIQIQIFGNFAQVDRVCYGTSPQICTSISGAPSSILINIPGDSSLVRSSSANQFHFYTKTTNTSQLVAQTFTFSVRELLASSDGTNPFTFVNGAPLTVWTLNGTILTAIWQNGNGGPLGTLNGRLYIWNPSNQAGAIIAQVFTLPVGMGGSTLIGTVNLGTLPALSATNIRVYEDILNSIPPLVTFPYTTNGGNIVIVLTINAIDCHGWSNVFGIFNGNYVSFGVVPMVETGPISNQPFED
jgi:hypothetical protein